MIIIYLKKSWVLPYSPLKIWFLNKLIQKYDIIRSYVQTQPNFGSNNVFTK